MAYTKQNFIDGQVLKAEHLNKIEQGIVNNENEIANKQPKGNYLTEHQKIKTINGQSMIGNGNIVIQNGSNNDRRYMIPNPVDRTIYSGMTIACIGDSITYETSHADPGYVKKLGQELGANMVNLGMSGAVLCAGGTRGCRIGVLAPNYLQNADVVTIMLGSNDWDAATDSQYSLGDINSTDTCTIYGAARMWCEKIQELKQTEDYANTKFYFMTPPIISWNGSMGGKNWDQNKVNIHGFKFRDLCQAIIDVCYEYTVPVIDLNLYSGIYYNSAEDENATQYGGDGIHPNTAGHALITEAIIRAFECNPEYKPTTDSINYILSFISKELKTELSYPVVVKEQIRLDVPVTGINLSVNELQLKAGAVYTVNATLIPANTTQTNIAWESSNESVARVSDGVITAIGEGSATITCKSADNASIKATVALTVTVAESTDLTALVMSDSTTTVQSGSTKTLSVTYVPSNTHQTGVAWETSDSNVATVQPSTDGKSCVVTAMNGGQCYITAKSTVNSAIKAQCFFTTTATDSGDEGSGETENPYIIGSSVVYDAAAGTLTAPSGQLSSGVSNIAIYNAPLKAGMEIEVEECDITNHSMMTVGLDDTNNSADLIFANNTFATGLVNVFFDGSYVEKVQSLSPGTLTKTQLLATGNTANPRVICFKRDENGTISIVINSTQVTMPTYDGVATANGTEDLYLFIAGVNKSSKFKVTYYGELRS